MRVVLEYVAYIFGGAVALAFLFATAGALALPKGRPRGRTWMVMFLLAIAVLLAAIKEGVEELAGACRKLADRTVRRVTGGGKSAEALNAFI